MIAGEGRARRASREGYGPDAVCVTGGRVRRTDGHVLSYFELADECVSRVDDGRGGGARAFACRVHRRAQGGAGKPRQPPGAIELCVPRRTGGEEHAREPGALRDGPAGRLDGEGPGGGSRNA